MKYLWLLLVIALVVSVITFRPPARRLALDEPVQAVRWWNPFERAAFALDWN